MTDFDDFKAQDPDQPQPQSGGFLKYCLICGCLVALLMGIAAVAAGLWFKSMFIMDPVRVEQNLKETIDVQVPQGYAGVFGMNLMGMKMSMLAPQGFAAGGQQQAGQMPLMIVVMQIPPGQNPQMAKQQMQQQLSQGGVGGGNLQVEKQAGTTLTVRGQQVEAQDAVGVQNGARVRQVFLLIDKAADDPTQVMLMFMGAEEKFDEEAMRAFLGSIK